MPKQFQLKDHTPSSSEHELTQKTDWSKCVVCQDETKETLRCPAQGQGYDQGSVYTTFAENVICFHQLQAMPTDIDIRRLDEGQGIAHTLATNSAKWHKSCHLRFNTTKRKRAEHRVSSAGEPEPKRRCMRLSSETDLRNKDICFFCDMNSTGTLHDASTLGIDSRVRKCAIELRDEWLLAKLSAGDMIAQNAKYHARCLAALYNRAAAQRKLDSRESTDEINHGIALAELVVFIEEAKMEEATAPIFKLADLSKMYAERLQQLGSTQSSRVHSTKLKYRILAQFPDLKAYTEGRDVLLAFDEDIGPALRKACVENHDEDAICLAKAARIVRRDMFRFKSSFNGSFEEDCQITSVPTSLLELTGMILHGPDIKTQSLNGGISQSTLSVAQLIQFNSYIRRREGSVKHHHNRLRETPVPIYVGLSVQAKTRKRELIDTLFDLGLSVSYERVMEILATMENRVCDLYMRENVVCPPNLRHGVFTTSAVDNIDHNPSSTTATESFHGTGISLFQHPKDSTDGTDRNSLLAEPMAPTRVPKLPESYTSIPPLLMRDGDIVVPRIAGPIKNDGELVGEDETKKEMQWLDHVQNTYLTDIQKDSNLSWAAYHASMQQQKEHIPALTAMLPLFPDQSKSVAMIRHTMDVIQASVDHLNPGQIPVITFDQPLYALCKQIQWTWPEDYGEDKFVILLGGLHIEMAAFGVVGDWLEDSGWVESLVHSDIATPGTAESFLKVSHVTRTRHAHQVTACALYILLSDAHQQYKDKLDQGVAPLSMEEWITRKSEESPQFLFWYTAMQLQLLVLTFVRSLRESNFQLYLETLTKLAHWFFAMDHTNYARWVPVHIRDMTSLSILHPQTHSEFLNGNFTCQKTRRTFSAIAIDQAHEQNNAMVKGDGGAIGLTQNPAALRRWMVGGPELARMVSEFEATLEERHRGIRQETAHHEQTAGVQTSFAKQVQALTSVMKDMGNPFLEESGDLLKLDSHDIMDQAVVKSIKEAQELGQKQYEAFVQERFEDKSVPLSQPIKKNKLALFSRQPVREIQKSKLQVASLKTDCALFARLFIACQTREGNLDEFFQHENQACPPALAEQGKLRPGKKSVLLECLEDLAVSRSEAPLTDFRVLDGAAVVNMVKPDTSKTFADYAEQEFLPYIQTHLDRADRVDLVWDIYEDNSLKSHTRRKRGKGVRRRVGPATAMPGNWQEFLRNDDNKTELFEFLADRVAEIQSDKELITTKGAGVLCNNPRDTSSIAPCSHEEADTRMMLHIADAVHHGFEKLLIRTVDTDVVVLAVTTASQLGIGEMWVAIGTGEHLKYIPAHEIGRSLGPLRCHALPMFHAYTGCDNVSAFFGVGKKTAWDVWRTFDEVTSAFLCLANAPDHITEECMDIIERYTILLYDRTSPEEDINKVRKNMFTRKGRTLDTIPPTHAALVQHTKRAAYQGGHCWGQALVRIPELPSPANWGWTNPTAWAPLWTTLPEASIACRELISCGCKKGCRGRCKCAKASLKCTALCQCGDDCERK